MRIRLVQFAGNRVPIKVIKLDTGVAENEENLQEHFLVGRSINDDFLWRRIAVGRRPPNVVEEEGSSLLEIYTDRNVRADFGQNGSAESLLQGDGHLIQD